MNFFFLTFLLIVWLSWMAYRDIFSPKWWRKKQKVKLELKEICNHILEENATFSKKM